MGSQVSAVLAELLMQKIEKEIVENLHMLTFDLEALSR